MAWIAIAMTTVFACGASGRIIYVDDDAPAPGDGSSWATAYKYLQDALAEAELAEKPVEVRVAQGVYKPDQSFGRPFYVERRQAAFHLMDQVTMRGGFAGVEASDPNARDFELYRSILSGDLAGNDDAAVGPLGMRNAPSRVDNSFHVISYNEDRRQAGGITAELDGLVITAGYAFAHEASVPWHGTQDEHRGGGLFVWAKGENSSQRITVRNCRFEHDYAEELGGAVYCKMSNLIMEGCTFIGNGTHAYGGAGYIECEGDAVFSDCRFEGNQAGMDGGGLHLAGSATLRGCLLFGNTARQGGGVYQSADPTILRGCIMSHNVASGGGGAIFGKGAVESIGCRYIGNRAPYGGALAVPNSGALTTSANDVFAGNRADDGGVIWTRYGRVRVLNCSASGNRASRGRFLHDATPAYTGSFSRDPAEITNSIILNGGDELWNSYGVTIVWYTSLFGGAGAVYDPHATIIWAEGNIDADPCFADAGHWDPNGRPDDPNDDFFVKGDYHLKSQAGRWDPVSGDWVQDEITSPCIDVGDPNTPIGQESFPNGGRINMGAYGGTVEASKSYFGKPICQAAIAGDINGDCAVDFRDLALLMKHWLEKGQTEK